MKHNDCKNACHEKEEEIVVFRKNVLRWYDKHRRVLPWRAEKGDVPNPYHVWLSEIMLQQTTVPAVMSYFIRFIEKWPDVRTLANAEQDDVLKEWAGLGYYARARNLHACANKIVEVYNGVFPTDQKHLKELPGIGEYTSAAIRSIAFDKPAVVVDGNIERIMSRYYAVTEPLPKSKKILHSWATTLSEGREDRPGDYAQALMDIGAGVCIAGTPRCALCPISASCHARKQGIAEELPKRLKKTARPQKKGLVFWITDEKGRVLLEKRPSKGLFASMAGLPTTNWILDKEDPSIYQVPLPFIDSFNGNYKNPFVEHVFTHFSLKLDIIQIDLVSAQLKRIKKPFYWVPESEIKNAGFPSLFRKVANICLTM